MTLIKLGMSRRLTANGETRRYRKGDIVEVADREAQRLIHLGLARPAERPATEPEPEQGGPGSVATGESPTHQHGDEALEAWKEN